MYCRNCGKQIDYEGRFCTFCGAIVQLSNRKKEDYVEIVRLNQKIDHERIKIEQCKGELSEFFVGIILISIIFGIIGLIIGITNFQEQGILGLIENIFFFIFIGFIITLLYTQVISLLSAMTNSKLRYRGKTISTPDDFHRTSGNIKYLVILIKSYLNLSSLKKKRKLLLNG